MRSKAENRTAPRIQFATRVLVQFDAVKGVTGSTVDVSESGAFITTQIHLKALSPGDFGVLKILHIADCAEMPCVVARVTETGIGVEFADICQAGLITQLKSTKSSLVGRLNPKST
ncbi:PilZ domain-containing protein [Magnetofaba australis]|uniref:PilZ domain-containing protein n=1 Tax=Magnetofaba australis TaxID=1472297 RepID=UPI000A19E255